jgi:arsenite-transporting ATPase
MGKGGVGKTTLSTGTALIAGKAARVLLVSTDAAHSLEDALSCTVGPEPVHVAPGVDAVQLDGRYELEHSWRRIADYARELIGVTDLGRLHRDELLVIPGLDHLLALARLKELLGRGAWDAIVVDCAPSADSLRLLSLPDVLDWYRRRLFDRDGIIRSRVRRSLERTLPITTPTDEVVTSFSELSQALGDLRRALADAETSVRIVLTPERLALAEAQRTMSYLALYRYTVDAVLVNRVVSADPVPHIDGAWQAQQARLLDEIERAFDPLPRLVCTFRPAEPIGIPALLAVGRELYGRNDPLRRLSTEHALEIGVSGDEARLCIPVSGVAPGSIGLHRSDSELIVTLGSYRRALVLPDGLRRQEIVGAKVVDGMLEISFAETAHAR